MPYYLETDDRELLKKLRLTNVCAECGGELEALYDIKKHLPYLQCKSNPDHEGIAKEYREPGELNIPTRREQLVQEHGEVKTRALAKVPTTGALTQSQAMHILKLVYPMVPEDEIVRCAILCRDFALHPLMKEVYIIPFGKGDKQVWVTVLGINATRKLMAQRGSFSYLDNTPRVMKEEEQRDIFGEVDPHNIRAITKLETKDGLKAQGYGSWPKDREPYGIDKGNSKANMAFIRSERNAFGRLFTDAIPQNVEIVDEAYIELPDVDKKVVEATGEIIEAEAVEVKEAPKEHWCKEHNCPFEKKVRGTSIWYAHPLPGGKWCNEAKPDSKKAEPKTPPINAELEGKKSDMYAFITEKKGWRGTKTVKDWLVNVLKISTERIDSDPDGVLKEVAELEGWDLNK